MPRLPRKIQTRQREQPVLLCGMPEKSQKHTGAEPEKGGKKSPPEKAE
jgi:hypothetical protein